MKRVLFYVSVLPKKAKVAARMQMYEKRKIAAVNKDKITEVCRQHLRESDVIRAISNLMSRQTIVKGRNTNQGFARTG